MQQLRRPVVKEVLLRQLARRQSRLPRRPGLLEILPRPLLLSRLLPLALRADHEGIVQKGTMKMVRAERLDCHG